MCIYTKETKKKIMCTHTTKSSVVKISRNSLGPIPIIQELEKLRQEDWEFEDSLGYTASSRPS
jgi:hypothetical protein